MGGMDPISQREAGGVMTLGKLAGMFRRYRKPPAPEVSSRVEDMARAKFPGDERGHPSPAQVEYRSELAGNVRSLCGALRTGGEIDKEAGDVVEAHFLAPRERPVK